MRPKKPARHTVSILTGRKKTSFSHFCISVIAYPIETKFAAELLVSRRPTLKRGSGETVYKKFELWNVYWMMFYVLRKCTVYVTTSIQPDPLQHHQTNSATLFIQHIKRTQQKCMAVFSMSLSDRVTGCN